MLTTQLYDAQGNLRGECADGQVGACTTDFGNFGGELDGLWSSLKSVGSSVGSVGKTVGKTVGRAGAAVGKNVYKAGAKAADVIEDGARYACKAVSNPSVQQGAKLVAQYGKYVPPNPYSKAVQGAAYATQAAGAVCGMAYPPKKPKKPKPPAPVVAPPAFVAPAPLRVMHRIAVPMPAPAPSLPKYPPGSFQWFEARTGKWKIAVARGRAVTGFGLGAPFDMPPRRRADYTANLYYQAATADAPYRAAYTGDVLGQAPADPNIEQVITSDKPASGTPIVSEEDAARRGLAELPWYRTWKLWVIVGTAGILGTGVLALVMLRQPGATAPTASPK
jgi:hypothetical protein